MIAAALTAERPGLDVHHAQLDGLRLLARDGRGERGQGDDRRGEGFLHAVS